MQGVVVQRLDLQWNGSVIEDVQVHDVEDVLAAVGGVVGHGGCQLTQDEGLVALAKAVVRAMVSMAVPGVAVFNSTPASVNA